jgi:ArsR family transcriptional regulator, arsenate/arsenite/antimonite-responsive transcriptional repressor
MRDLIKLLKVLSDESRLRVVNLLQERECCVCEVIQVMGISQSKASRILSALYDAGLLKLKRDGRWALYSLDKDNMKDYANYIFSGVTKVLDENSIFVKDREKLKITERIGPKCNGNVRKLQFSNKVG